MKVSDGIGHRPPAQDRGQRHAVRAPGHGQPGLFRMAAQCTVLRNPGLNQVPLHARQQDLAVVQRQAERIEGRMGGGAATSGTPTGQGRAPREAEGRSLAVADGDAAAFSLVTLLPFSSFRTSGFSSDH
jgi:hypothetical protein